jgi:hypothetical protein
VQLDRTKIAIRPRGTWELLDLALRVTWIYRVPLLLSTMVLGLPFAFANAYLLHWIVVDEYSNQTIERYLLIMTLLVFLEAPIATLSTTQVLGRIMFLQDISWRAIFGELRQAFGRVVWTQGLFRGGILAVILAVQIRPSVDATVAEVMLGLLAAFSMLLRATRPFINEIVLLERNPIRKTNQRTITIGRRSNSLHTSNTGDLMGRWFSGAIASVTLTVSIGGSLWFAIGLLSNQWTWGTSIVQLAIPTAMWVVVVFATVYKFLCYLDLRIRREGWEVELRVRAAANEIRGQLAQS